MAVSLTQSEVELAGRLIGRLEERGRRWRSARFFVLFVAVLSLAVAAWAVAVGAYVARQVEAPLFVAGKELSAHSLAIETQSRFHMALGFSRVQCTGYIWAACGGWLIAYTLTNWRQHLRHALIAKVRQAHLQVIAAEREAQSQG